MSKQIHFNAMLDSLTGYDEQAIEDIFKNNISELLATNATKAGRAMVFVDRLRKAGGPEHTVKVLESVMGMPLGEINAYWADDDEPEAEPGGEVDNGKPPAAPLAAAGPPAPAATA
jgi:hypothetical protein